MFHRKRTSPLRHPLGPVVALLVALAALLAACGGESSSSTSASARSSLKQTGVLFDSCVREHGVPEFPDSAVRVIEGEVLFHIPADLKKNPQFQTASHVCEHDLPQSSSNSESHSLNVQEGVDYARCMRAHGIEYANPEQSGQVKHHENPEAPAFKAASKTCSARAFREVEREASREAPLR